MEVCLTSIVDRTIDDKNHGAKQKQRHLNEMNITSEAKIFKALHANKNHTTELGAFIVNNMVEADIWQMAIHDLNEVF